MLMRCEPAIVGVHHDVKVLRPVEPSEQRFDEAWLQELIFRCPRLLPAELVDKGLGALIPIAKEFAVPSGHIDNLYLTLEGRLCLVETKLWRNPQAHRTVLAQIIDYAKDLAGMEFDEFERRCLARGGATVDSLCELVKSAFPEKELDEITLEGAIRRSLRTADFLLLIVGDRIRPEVVMLSDAVQSAPHLEFSIALVELRFYKLEDAGWPLLVVPSIVGRTQEVTRSVVKIRYERAQPKVAVTAFEETPRATAGRTDLETFLKSLPSTLEDVFRHYLDKWLTGPFFVYWGKTGFSLRLRKGEALKTIIDAYPDYVSIFKREWLEEWNCPLRVYQRYRESVNDIVPVIAVINAGKRYVHLKDLSPEDLEATLRATDELANELAGL